MTNASGPKWREDAEPRQWSVAARDLIDTIYAFWAENRRPPDAGELYRATGLSRHRTRRLIRELQEGFAILAPDGRVGLSIDKAPPFSATSTTVAAFEGDVFISFVGCPMEGLTIGPLPPFEGKVLTLRSYCACCYEPIELGVRGQEVLTAQPKRPLVSMIRSPYDWEGGVTPDVVCDSFHYVLDADHAERFEKAVFRRGTTMTLEQAGELTSGIAAGRMRDPHFPQIRIEAEPMISYMRSIGVAVDVWEDQGLPASGR